MLSFVSEPEAMLFGFYVHGLVTLLSPDIGRFYFKYVSLQVRFQHGKCLTKGFEMNMQKKTEHPTEDNRKICGNFHFIES